MKQLVVTFFILSFCVYANALTVSQEDAQMIGDRIWHNEAAGSTELLTHWNKGENFASLGIGHFIWYKEGNKERFQEMFPELLQFLQKQGITFPSWLKTTSPCPWNSREDFYHEFQSTKMKELRQFLVETKGLQATFMAVRLENTLPKILETCSNSEKKHIEKIFNGMARTPIGLYALIDYLNFKGAGISPTETYKGQGWGLKQVLLRVPENSKHLSEDFSQSAKELLSLRVQNSPPERNESKWLEGWYNRLDSYKGKYP